MKNALVEVAALDRTGGRKLRIAVLAPIAWRTPPRAYGPWELFASLLAEGLVARGHDVTLFATGDSITSANLASVVQRCWNEDLTSDRKVSECAHIAAVFERADEFDIIHNSFDFLPLSFSRLVSTPVVTTIHGFSSPQVVDIYRRYDDHCEYVSISDSNRHPDLSYAATIHHGIDTSLFTIDESPGDSLLFFGRIHPDKGTAAAIRVAKKSGRRLVIAGIIQDQEYFQREIEPHLDGDHVCFVDALGGDARLQALRHAYALLHLIDFEEPFGFSVAEALASGTPVIAFARGAMPELIDHGITGFLVDSESDAVAAVGRVASLDRAVIRIIAADRFHHMRMVDAYLDVYRRILAGSRTPVSESRISA